MAASSNLDNIGIQSLRISDWRLGINTATPPTEIDDSEVQDLLNFEFDNNGNISTRRGVTELLSTTFGRLTSFHYFTVDTGEVAVLFTEGTKLRKVLTNGTSQADISGALTFPNDTFWSWVTFNGIAIGCNRATTGDNPVKVTSGLVASALPGTPPKAKYAAVWENRVWLVSASSPNQIQGSKLGDPENWTATGAAGAVTLEIDTNDGDLITGIYATRDALYIFKRRSIHRLIPIAQPITDPNNLKREVVTRNIGCVSHYSIQQVVDDVLFLSDQGIASLTLVATAENFKTAFYSRNVSQLERFSKITEEIPSILLDTAAQYLISLPTAVSPTGKPNAYVMDYLRLNDGFVRWTRFDGLAAGTAYTSFNDASGKLYLIGADSTGAGVYKIYKYRPRDTTGTFSDNGAAYTKAIAMKSYNGNAQLLRKAWVQWAIGLNLLSATAGISVAYYFDQNINRTDSYSFGLTGIQTGALWAAGLWGAGLWGTTFAGQNDIVRPLKSNSIGRESQDITFNISNAQVGEGFTIQDFQIDYMIMNDRRVTDA